MIGTPNERTAMLTGFIAKIRQAATLEEVYALADEAEGMLNVGCPFAPDTVTEEAKVA